MPHTVYLVNAPFLVNTFLEWAVPENIHTIPLMAFWNSDSKGEFFEMEIRRHGGILTIGIPKAWGVPRSGISTDCIP